MPEPQTTHGDVAVLARADVGTPHPLNSLGFAKAPAKTRVVVAMSGGVDSSVVAAMLHAEGYEVIGITLQLYDHGEAIKKAGACCAGQDIRDARAVADRLGVPHYVLDYESRFREAVIEDFAESYLAGETPIPCVKCNQSVKFADLLATAQDLGADCLATGHYVQRLLGKDGAELHRGADPDRDQSYFLFATTQTQVDFLRFPLGGLLKPDVRKLADQFGLVVANKPDSQDICFVPNGSYTDVVLKVRPDGARPGNIVGLDGEVLGTHRGVIYYTIGQRRGLGIAVGEPLFVVRLDAERAEVVVGPREALLTDSVRVTDVNWLGAGGTTIGAQAGTRVLARVRSTRPPRPGTLREGPVPGDWYVHLDAPEEGVAPGQACVWYAEDAPTRCLGGGWIRSGA